MPAWAGGSRPQSWWQGLPALIAVLLLLAGAVWLAARLDPLPPRFTGAARVSDGDTLRLGTDRIRLLGIDAPELDQTCTDKAGKPWRCGEAAREALATLIGNRRLSCTPHGHDRYERTLARCSVGETDIGRAMVAAGLAVSYPDYRAEEAAARLAGRGLWGGHFQSPRDWRDNGPEADPGPDWIEQLWSGFRELTGARMLR